jgi:hypothetical protein
MHLARLLYTIGLGALLEGCAAIPVQETTLKNANGGSVTCKVGRGIVSYGVGTHRTASTRRTLMGNLGDRRADN